MKSRLTFIKNADRKRYGIYRCLCGNTKEIRISDVNRGKSKSCSCLRKEKAKLNNKNTWS